MAIGDYYIQSGSIALAKTRDEQYFRGIEMMGRPWIIILDASLFSLEYFLSENFNKMVRMYGYNFNKQFMIDALNWIVEREFNGV